MQGGLFLFETLRASVRYCRSRSFPASYHIRRYVVMMDRHLQPLCGLSLGIPWFLQAVQEIGCVPSQRTGLGSVMTDALESQLCYVISNINSWVLRNDAANAKTARALLRRASCEAPWKALDSGGGSRKSRFCHHGERAAVRSRDLSNLRWLAGSRGLCREAGGIECPSATRLTFRWSRS
jgi:hypothetical protein